MSKNKGYEAWAARLGFFRGEFGFGPIKRILNEDGRLHCDNGPAYISPTRVMWYRNGKQHGLDADKFGSILYYYEGVRKPPHFFTKPETVTLKEVLQHANSEVRYVGMKVIGLETIMSSKETRIIHKDQDQFGRERILFQIPKVFEEPTLYVKVVNSTPEPDGTYKNYFLCVPPTMKTCQQAVAWTNYLTADKYHPSQES